MAQSVNKGRRIHVWNETLSTTPTQVVLNQKVNGLIIQCRTAANIRFYEDAGNSEYYTIKSGDVLHLDFNARNYEPFALASESATPVAEIVGLLE